MAGESLESGCGDVRWVMNGVVGYLRGLSVGEAGLAAFGGGGKWGLLVGCLAGCVSFAA